ncbi:MAG: GGDEF domain-containing protein [Desulfovibrio sp.]|jgi:diguanylate cyclase (GGDEF)-like protein|nr:GGDEF domain-containing protein [Desulfovibrio sp.]
MATPAHLPAVPGGDLSPDLVRELEQVAQLIQTKAGARAGAAQALALTRIVSQVSLEEWERFASLHGLEQWTIIPLNGDPASAASSFQATLERMSFQRDHDVLTGLANRRLFDRRLEEEIERAIRSQNELCLMLLDLDNFKGINDTYGHLHGDIVLQRLGEVLSRSVRSYDLAARIGGEEFALIFPATSCWTGIMLGDRILKTFSREIFHAGKRTFSITFSAGISSLALLEGAVSAKKLLAEADAALYAAKNRGKNRILVAQSGRRAQDRAGMVRSHEKEMLFSSISAE